MPYQALYAALEGSGFHDWAKLLPSQLHHAFDTQKHGDLSKWRKAIDDLPMLAASGVDLKDTVRIGCAEGVSELERQYLVNSLQKLHPWRKGPYELFGINLDTEWRSDWKWDRLKDHISSLKNKVVLDVGCGNGYHCWRMLGEGAKLVIGIDPTLLSVMQFLAVKKLYAAADIYVLPLGIEEVLKDTKLFDTVFSMGVLYHRRSPIDHLLELKGCLRTGGELILETLVIEGNANQVLVPEGRYAQMRNVWFLPSCDALMLWMSRCGFQDIKLVNVSKTGIDEQRTTEWMRFHSLKNFLNPLDPSLTCEGLPAPMRAIFVAKAD